MNSTIRLTGNHFFKAVKFGLFSLLLFFFSVNYISLLQIKKFHEDEVTFVERGVFFDYYVNGQFSLPEWRSFASFDVPKFAEMFYGLMIVLNSQETVTSFLHQTHFLEEGDHQAASWRIDFSRDFCCTIQDLPSSIQRKIQPILIARQGSFLFTIGSLVIIFLIGLIIRNWFYGMISMLLIGTNSLFQGSMITAMGDSALIFFSLLFLLITILGLTDITTYRKKGILYVLILGFIGGLAIAVKLNGIINLLFFTVFLLTTLLQKKEGISLFPISKLLLLIWTTAYSTFFLLNPFVWANPLMNTVFMAQHRANTFHFQQASPLFTAYSLTSIPDRFVAFYNVMLSIHATYSNFDLKNIYFPTDMLILFFGICLLSRRVRTMSICLFFFWLVTWFLMTVFLIPLNWDRYWLPPVLVTSLLQCFAIEIIFSDVFNKLKKRVDPLYRSISIMF